MNETKVNQNPGAVLVFPSICKSSMACLTSVNRAIWIAKEINVIKAARKDTRDATSVRVTCVENDRRNAMNITAVADEWQWLSSK